MRQEQLVFNIGEDHFVCHSSDIVDFASEKNSSQVVCGFFAADKRFTILKSENHVLFGSNDQATASLTHDHRTNRSTRFKITEDLDEVWREAEAASNREQINHLSSLITLDGRVKCELSKLELSTRRSNAGIAPRSSVR